MLLHADSKDADQTGRMPRLTCVVTGRTGHFVCFVVIWLNFILHVNREVSDEARWMRKLALNP